MGNKHRAKRAFEGLESYDKGYKDGLNDAKDCVAHWLEFAHEYQEKDIYQFIKEVIEDLEDLINDK